MADPQVLLARAGRCRSAAGRIRQQAEVLGQVVPDLTIRHPVDAVWKGPAADRFTAAVGSARSRVTTVVTEAQDYAAHLLRAAERLEREAQQEEQRLASAAR